MTSSFKQEHTGNKQLHASKRHTSHHFINNLSFFRRFFFCLEVAARFGVLTSVDYRTTARNGSKVTAQ